MPDRLYIDKTDKELYEKLENNNILNFKGKNQKEQFLLAMAIGFEQARKNSIDKRQEFFFSSNLRPDDRTLINSIALSDSGNTNILADEKEVFTIAEEFARGGIRILAEAIEKTQFGQFEKIFERELFDTFKDITAGNAPRLNWRDR